MSGRGAGVTLWPVLEFRPTANFFAGEFRRFAGGKWLPDDGEYDLAFIGKARSGEGWNYPACLMIDLPYRKNIVYSWCTNGNWGRTEPRHPRGNAWHYVLRNGSKKWGEDWGRDHHKNILAGNSGMNKMSSESGCCNGRHVEFRDRDPHILAGLVRELETKRVVELFPPGSCCMYCGDLP